jgi:predicted O-methyltransferase YrrM
MNANFWRKVYTRVSNRVLNSKLIRHQEPSLIFSPNNNDTNDFLINLAIEAIAYAWNNKIIVPNEKLNDAVFYNVFPGEHYRLIKAIANILNPNVILEIGTATGMGSIALMQGQAEGCLYTFDIIPWDSFSSHLSHEYFDSKKLFQIISDLSDLTEFNEHIDLLNRAEIIFMDAPKNGRFEYKFLSLLQQLEPKTKKLLIIDDIRFVNMIDLWISIESPKLDITSFGHWSGMGLVDISGGLKLRNS